MSSKRDLLLEAGRRLFWKYGIRRVTTDEICREAGVSRMTFYRCFDNKTHLVKTIYSNLVEDTLARFFDIIRSGEASSERMKKLLMLKMESTENLSREFLVDLYDSPGSELHQFVEKTNRRIWGEMIEGFRYAQENGMFRKSFNPEFLMIISQKLATIMTDKELLQLYDNPQDLIMEFLNLITYGIAPEK
ncbi:MAG TPA: TetR/AcrR family transcriptional regulator [Bacteroidales bacterium]|nr:TetR/AcrR family transcriptional regulator [Bacteroidales bacterium]